jgi:NAD(P)-dependent dehydrogenase (short-subunit alcohol dehydrogenase family)
MTETVVVLGATGNIGREITAQLVSRGRRVAAVARNVDRLQALAKRVNSRDRLVIVPGAVDTEFNAEHLARTIREQGHPITAVVSSLRGPTESGRLLSRTAPAFLRSLETDLVAPFIAAKHFLPLLAEAGPGGLYLMLGGPMASCAWSGYGHLSVAASALQMLTHVIREEAKELPVTVQELQIGTPVRSEANADCACPDWIGADEVARRVALLIERRDTAVPIVQLGTYENTRRARPALRSIS